MFYKFSRVPSQNSCIVFLFSFSSFKFIDSRKSLLNVFRNRICHPKMAMVIDNRLKVWEDKDQPRVHVVPAFTPYYAPQAEVLSFFVFVFGSLFSEWNFVSTLKLRLLHFVLDRQQM